MDLSDKMQLTITAINDDLITVEQQGRRRASVTERFVVNANELYIGSKGNIKVIEGEFRFVVDSDGN
jgi:hypothetical protein